ncbi:MAG: type II secretion system F family protein [Comamonadaceae bacterium]|nr:MAG: type II secretion system F family protein [Comamonadaceae bacterium]
MSPVFLLLIAAGTLLLAAVMLVLLMPLPARRVNRRLSRLLAPPVAQAPPGPVKGWPARVARRLAAWLDTAIGRALLAPEDKVLLDRAGFDHEQGRALFFGSRLASAGILLLAWFAFRPSSQFMSAWTFACAAYAGVMLPKWLLRARAGRRLAAVKEELPLLIDLLRLLQGSGMSLDQSLRVAALEFRDALPVLSVELEIADRQHSAGLARAESFRRMTRLYEDDTLSELVTLLVQLDRHGGAVDEPLRRFGARLREQQRMQLRGSVGKRNVKMTVIMVATLLPALMVVIGGPAFLAITRTLGTT